MMKREMIKVIVLCLTISLTTVGCNMQGTAAKKPQQQSNNSQEQVQTDPVLAEQAKETAKAVEGVDESTAVVMNQELSVAVKVSGFDRLRLKAIRQEVHRNMKKLAPDHKIYVTSDKKLFWELEQVEQQIVQPGGKPLTDLQAKVKKINKGMAG